MAVLGGALPKLFVKKKDHPIPWVLSQEIMENDVNLTKL